MPKFMIRARYTADGVKGLRKDKASGRQRAVSAACAALGGTLDAMYYALGEDDVLAIVDLPSTTQVASLCAAVGASGAARTRTVPLLTVAEMDEVLGAEVELRPPGSA